MEPLNKSLPLTKTQQKPVPEPISEGIQETLDNFFEISRLIYRQEVDGVFIGGELLTEELRGALRDDARFFERSRLWDIINATIINESAQIALNQSTSMEQVYTGKMLYYWAQTFRKMITELSK